MTGQDPKFAAAQRAFAACHHEDPRGEAVAYHASVVHWVMALDPRAPAVVRLAALGQHVQRWTIPRDTYPTGRTGYRAWRSVLSQLHGRRCREVLLQVGYEEAVAARVADLVQKRRLRSDPEAGLLQDAVCLTFLQSHLEAFARGREEAQIVTILAKTWAKMTARGHAAARTLAGGLPERMGALLAQALAED